MTACDGNLHRSFCRKLTFYVFYVLRLVEFASEIPRFDFQTLQFFRARKISVYLRQRMRGVNIESLDILRFFLVSVRYDYVVVALLLCRNDNGKNAVYTAKLAVERQLSEKNFIFQSRTRQLLGCGKHTYRHCKVVKRALFFGIRRRKVYHNLANRKPEARISDCKTYSFLGFLHRRVGKTDNVAGGDARVHIDLYVYGISVKSR